MNLNTPTILSLENARECAAFSLAAYQDEPTINDDICDTQLIIRDLGNCLVIAFRGTKGLRDMLTDASCRLEKFPYYGVEIHSGFYTALEAVWFQITSYILAIEEKPIIVCGHSLGGAEAMLLAWRLHNNSLLSSRLHSVYTFGQPRVGNAAFAKNYNAALGERTFRFINQEDIVPRVPGLLLGYRHAGQRVFISSGGVLELNPDFLSMLWSDLCGIIRAWTLRREITLISEHGLVQYINQLNEVTA